MFINDKIRKKISHLAINEDEFFFLIDFSGEKCEVLTPDEASANGIYYWINGKTNFRFRTDTEMEEINNIHLKNHSALRKFLIFPVSFNEYHESFKKVQEALKRGDTYLLNLTFRTRIETDYSLEEIFRKSSAKYKLLYKDKFVVFSPEKFVTISDGIIETRPMKGTISASIADAENKLLSDPKELYEHNTIVDLLRNDLNIISEDVKVVKFRYIDRIRTNTGEILQVSSVITGKLPENYAGNLGNILSSLLPAGSVTGAPKERTVDLIKKIENYERGYYTGIFGYFDGRHLESAVSIRFIEKEGDTHFYKSGGGVTALSNAYDEYNELISKIYVPVPGDH